MFGNYYIYDAINPLGDIFASQLGFTDEIIGWLNSSYASPPSSLLIGGWMIDGSASGWQSPCFRPLPARRTAHRAQVISGDGGRKGGARAGADRSSSL